jgi:hypothetical protein
MADQVQVQDSQDSTFIVSSKRICSYICLIAGIGVGFITLLVKGVDVNVGFKLFALLIGAALTFQGISWGSDFMQKKLDAMVQTNQNPGAK